MFVWVVVIVFVLYSYWFVGLFGGFDFVVLSDILFGFGVFFWLFGIRFLIFVLCVCGIIFIMCF